MLFSTKLGSRRQIKFKYNTVQFISNIYALSKESIRRIPHPDTLGYLLKYLSAHSLDALRYTMMQMIIRKKSLSRWRLFNKWYLVGVDGTGYLGFRYNHCEKCMRRKLANGDIYYYHPVLESKLITGNGLSLSIGTEFIRNIPGKDRQDCEVMAFYRWAKQFKKKYPQLRICLLLDGLYARRPVYELCKRYGWKYIIVFKRGNNSTLYDWYETMREKGSVKNHKSIILKDRIQHYQWLSPFEHYSDEIFHIFECREEYRKSKKETKRFVWITNIPITEKNVDTLANGGGRLRWKIENEGFNSQKCGGYEMEHAYSHHPNGMKNFYLLMQIAHIIDQLVEKGSLLKKYGLEKLGSMKNIAYKLLENLRTSFIDISLFDQRIQIRLNSG